MDVDELFGDESDAVVGLDVMNHDERKVSARFDDDPLRIGRLRAFERCEVRVGVDDAQNVIDGVVGRRWR